MNFQKGKIKGRQEFLKDYSEESKENGFLRSALTEKNQFQTLEKFMLWFESRKKANRFIVKQIPFDKLDKWYFENETQNLIHESGKFFKIKGIRVSTNFGAIDKWDQPIIDQPEIGILGIITKKFDGVRYFLMQAKMEPGNPNIIQLSPTVQATKSNYTQVHKGKRPLYLEFFIDKMRSKILVDQLQTEYGGIFLKKRNRNMIVEVEEDVSIYDDFCWLTLGQIKKLLLIDNFVNMDARSVLSCVPFISQELEKQYESLSLENFLQSELFKNISEGFKRDLLISLIDKKNVHKPLAEILNWLTEMKSKYELKIEEIPLKDVSDWMRTEREIKHKTKQFFSVIAVAVQAGNREITSWTQPLLKQPSYGLVGFLTKKINRVIHFLIQARLEPGSFNIVEINPTVACNNARYRVQQQDRPPFLELFINASPIQIRYSTIQSDEGGRFFHSQNKHMILELDSSASLDIPENYMWVSLGQIMELLKHSYLNIDARGLISCLGLI